MGTTGLDGSGCNKIYNWCDGNPQFNTQNFILFAFKMSSMVDSDVNIPWTNETPNSPFCVRPIALEAQKENVINFQWI